MKLNITRAHALTPHLIEIEAKGPRGGDYHFAAYYERDGAMRLIVETNPTTTLCHPSGSPEIPSEVLSAARYAQSQAAQ